MHRHRKKIIVISCLLLGFLLYLYSCLPSEKETDKRHFSTILGQEESCMGCHGDMTGFAPSHNPEVLGCSPCHGGDPHQKEKEYAHENMLLVPGNLSNVDQTCGTVNCHHDLADRVKNSLMTSMSGAITVNRFFFGDSDTLIAHAHVRDLLIDTPSDNHFRHLCASCHLGNEKTLPAPVSERSRGGGCIACHLDYSEESLSAHLNYHKNKTYVMIQHFPPSLEVDYGVL